MVVTQEMVLVAQEEGAWAGSDDRGGGGECGQILERLESRAIRICWWI